MKNWKDKVLGIFAVIGVMTLLMGNYAQQPKGVWEMHQSSGTGESRVYTLNTETGEVRKYSRTYPNVKGQKIRDIRRDYITMRELPNE